MNITTLLDMAAEAFGDRCAVVQGETRMDFATLRRQALAAAATVRDSGARHLAVLDVNSPAVPVALFAAAYAGVPYVPLNFRLTDSEIDALLARIRPCLLVAGPQFAGRVGAQQGLRLMPRAEFLAAAEATAAEAADAQAATPAEDPSAVAVQLFTSGTTGAPKAAVLRHEHLSAYILGTVDFGAAGEDEALLVTVPAYHIAGVSAVLSATYAARRSVWLEAFEPAAWVDACAAESVTHAFVVPTMLARILDAAAESSAAHALASLRAIAYGGGRMPQEVIERAMTLLPQVDFTNAYGLTETSATICLLDPEAHRAAAASDDPAIRRRLGSVGRSTGAVEIQIRDEAGRPLGPEAAGLVFVRGPQVAGEYLALGSQLDADGWFPTRDRGFLDAEGYLFLDGRADDVIVRGGENISPGEVEEVLQAHPAVQEAAVVAVPDSQWGEAVGAVIVPAEGATVDTEALRDWVRQRLRSSRVPAHVRLRAELPYNEMGKLLRRVLRDELAQAVARDAGAAA